MGVLASTRNPTVRAARRLGRMGARRADDAFLVEGPQAVRAGAACLERLFITAEAAAAHPDLTALADAAGAEVLTVNAAVLNSIATTRSPQGVVGVAVRPPAPLTALHGARLATLCWQARDPGNVGTLIRTADAAGADAFALTASSVDARNPKAVRASAGSLFHLPVIDEPDWEAVRGACRDAGLRLVAADASAPTTHLEADLAAPVAFVFGNEAHGLPPDVRADCETAVAVPVYGRAESLNLAAAAAVLLYEAARQHAAKAVSG